jgi:two-component system, OmpR family, sensor kinase
MARRLGWRRPRMRTRVALAAAGSILVAMVVLGTAVQVLLSRHLHESLDDSLRSRAAAIAQLNATSSTLVTSPSALETSVGPQAVEVQVLARSGVVVGTGHAPGVHAPQLRVHSLAMRVIKDGRPVYTNASAAGDDDVRVYIAPLADLPGPASGGAVVVAVSTDEVMDTLAESEALIVLSAIVAALVVVPIAFVVTGRALTPLTRLAGGAEVIEARGDPSLRLPVEPVDGRAPDELDRLAETLNRMLAGLERARDRERRFVADASHELRNPLTALRGNAAFLARNGADAAALDDLRADADRLSKMVEELLVLAREDAGEPPTDPVRLDQLAEELAGERVTVRAEDAGWVRGDAGALGRALANLVDNGLRHGPPGGVVTVTVSQAGDEVHLEVADEGPGIPLELADKATQRFWRGEGASAGDGSGLGLALVRAAAERHGGRLEISGPRMVIHLPALKPLSRPPDTP